MSSQPASGAAAPVASQVASQQAADEERLPPGATIPELGRHLLCCCFSAGNNAGMTWCQPSPRLCSPAPLVMTHRSTPRLPPVSASYQASCPLPLLCPCPFPAVLLHCLIVPCCCPACDAAHQRCSYCMMRPCSLPLRSYEMAEKGEELRPVGEGESVMAVICMNIS